MSGLEIVGFILTPLEHAISITQRLIERYQSFNRNSKDITTISTSLLRHKTDLDQLTNQLQNYQHYIPHENQQFTLRTLQTINDIMQDMCKELTQLEKTFSKSRLVHFMKAKSIANKFEDMIQLLTESSNKLHDINALITQVSSTVSITEKEASRTRQQIQASIVQQKERINTNTNQTNVALDVNPVKEIEDRYESKFELLTYSPATKLSFDQTNSHGHPSSIEAKIKSELLKFSQSSQQVIAIHGSAGVGKTTILRVLTHQNDVQRFFSDGLYYIKIGADATSKTVVEQVIRVVEISGGYRVAKTMAQYSDIEKVIQQACDWFRDKRVLFLIDDIWYKDGAGVVTVRLFRKLLFSCKDGGMVYTTRDASVALEGNVFKVSRREPRSMESRMILMTHARCAEGTKYSERTEKAIGKVLNVCAGLPVAHGVVGKAVAQYSLHCTSGMEGAWEWYTSSHASIIDSIGDEYGSLHSTFMTALQVVDQNHLSTTISQTVDNIEVLEDDRNTRKRRYSYHEMHRALCVLEKQQRAPLSLLGCIWDTRDRDEVRNICEMFVRVGLAEWDLGSISNRNDTDCKNHIIEGISMHDLLHDFTVAEAKRSGEIKKWHNRVIEGYSKVHALSVSDINGCREWWNIKEEKNDVEDPYLMQNICRHMNVGDSCLRELMMLVTRPSWIAKQLVWNGICQYKSDVRNTVEKWINWEQSGAISEEKLKKKSLKDEMLRSDIELIRDAVLRSVPYVLVNPGEIWFQLYDRLMSVKNNSSLRNYICYIERNAPRPWIRPISSCLTSIGSSKTRVGVNISAMVVIERGKKVICGCGNGEIVIVNTRECYVSKRWHAHSKAVNSLAVTDDDRFLISGSRDKSAKVWKVDIWNEVRSLNGHLDAVTCVWIDRNGRIAFTGSADGTVRMWNIENGEQLGLEFDTEGTRINCIAVLYNGKVLLAGGDEEKLFIWKVKPTEDLIGDASLLWNQSVNRRIGSEIKMKGWIQSMTISKDESKLAIGYIYGGVRIWNIETMIQECRSQQESNYSINCGAFNENGTRFVFASLDNRIFLCDSRSGSLACEPLQGHHDCVTGVEFINEGNTIVSCSWDATVRLWGENHLQSKVSTEAKVNDSAWCCTKTPNGSYFVSGHLDGKLRVWDASTGHLVKESRKIHDLACLDVALSINGKRIFSASDDNTIQVCDFNTLEVISSLHGHNNTVTCLDVSPVGNQLVTGSYDKTIRIWDIGNHDGSHITISHGDWPKQVFVSQDGKRIISKSNSYIRTWDMETTRCINKISSPEPFLSKEEILSIAEERVHDNENKKKVFCHRFGKEIRHGSLKDSVVLASLESGVRDWEFESNNSMLCIVLIRQGIAFLKLED